jgi:Leucine-rich repeat (LRR) protein
MTQKRPARLKPRIHSAFGLLSPLHILLTLFSIAHCSSAMAQNPVHFPDANLKSAVEDALWINDPTPTDMLGLQSFSCINREVKSIKGLQYAKNLQTLSLTDNQFSDISPLSKMNSLRKLVLNNNQISNLSHLSGLKHLSYLDLHENQISNISALSGLDNLQVLVIRLNQIKDISPLSGLMNLRDLDLRVNHISDISPLSELTNLQDLSLRANQISNISALGNLSSLTHLYLNNNDISTIAPLASLARLRDLYLSHNQISNISALLDLVHLQTLDLRYNPLGSERVCSHLNTIMQNNPGLSYFYSGECDPTTSSIVTPDVSKESVTDITESSATLRARVVNDGADTCEGRFRYWITGQSESTTPWQSSLRSDMIFKQEIQDLQPDCQYSFVAELKNSVGLDITGTGSFATEKNTIIHVDDDAPFDPRPHDLHSSDPLEDGTAAHPFDSIQEAIADAAPNSVVLVKPGTYYEGINLMGKDISVSGIDPSQTELTALPVIDGNDMETPVTFNQGEGPQCQLSGFVLTRGRDEIAGAIACLGSSPTIRSCLVVGNLCDGPRGAIIYCQDSNSIFENLTVHGNMAGDTGAAFRSVASNVVLSNSILWGNVPDEIVIELGHDPLVSYSNVMGTWPGPSNIEVNPEFAMPGFWTTEPLDSDSTWIPGDYHLASEIGRWEPNDLTWLADALSSPCIDAGDPNSPHVHEPAPNGERLNMGVYGGTEQASLSSMSALDL